MSKATACRHFQGMIGQGIIILQTNDASASYNLAHPFPDDLDIPGKNASDLI